MTWPGKDGTGVITLAFRPVDATPEVMTSESGAWAWLRMLRGGDLQPTDLPDALPPAPVGAAATTPTSTSRRRASTIPSTCRCSRGSRARTGSDPPRLLRQAAAGRRLRHPPAARRTSSASGTAGSRATWRRASPTALAASASPSRPAALRRDRRRPASADRAGRRFPLTLAAPAAARAPTPRWLAALAAARAAPPRGGELSADALDARLRALPLPAADGRRRAAPDPLDRRARAPRPSTPRPRPDLDALLAAPAEAR